MHKLLFLSPGHFHAALLLKSANPRVDPVIHVYAEDGPELQAFVKLVESFNARAKDPTRWDLELHIGASPRERLLDERLGDIAVLAGRNDSKLDNIAVLHAAGFAVLADKPWLTSAAALPLLETVTSKAPLVMDIMTSRHDTLARLRRHLVRSREVFGGFATHDDPAPVIRLGIVHHLYKRVNGQPLRRPDWYFDTRVQGDGLTDIQSHMLDQAQWLLAEEDGSIAAPELVEAQLWPTRVDPALFRDCTGLEYYPEFLVPDIADGALNYQCNGRIRYRLQGQLVEQSAQWFEREPEGSGDQHIGTIRGALADVRTRLGPDTGFKPALEVVPRRGADIAQALAALIARLRTRFQGLRTEASEDGFTLHVPETLEGGHETHFAMVLDEFLTAYESNWSSARASIIRQRYALLAQAQSAASG